MSFRIIENSTAKGFAALAKRLQAGEFYVKVGVPDAPAVDEHGTASHEVTLSDTATWLEFGTQRSVAGADGKSSFVEQTPERPIFRNGIKNNIGELQRLGKVSLVLIAQGQATISQQLGLMGALAAGRIKQEFGSSELAPNVPSTIVKKGSSKPGIDTAQTKNAVTWEVIGRD